MRTAKTREWWRSAGRISVEEAQVGYSYFRIVPAISSEYADYDSSMAQGRMSVIESPRVPTSPLRGENRTTPRVSLAPSIWAALAGCIGRMSAEDLLSNNNALVDAGGRAHNWYVYGIPTGRPARVEQPTSVPDAKITGEVWATRRVRMEFIGVVGGDYGPDGSYAVWICPDRTGSIRREINTIEGGRTRRTRRA